MRSSGVQLRREPAGPLAGGAGARLVWSAQGNRQVFTLSASHGIGRHPDNDLQLLDSLVSKFHCQIELKGSECFLYDLASLNGTYVNAQRVTGRQALAPGDAIVVGSNTLFLEIGDPPARSADGDGWVAHARFVGAIRGMLETRDSSALVASVLRVTLDLFDADWGGWVELAADRTPKPHLSVALPGKSTPPLPARFDAALVISALELGRASVRIDWVGNAYRAAKPQTLIAIPLLGRNGAFGVLWLEREGVKERGPFAEIEILGRLAALELGLG